MKQLLSGNEAIALGAMDAGVRVAAGYPGTPSTEILENLARYEGPHVQWSPNEKVALEVAIGASLGGARTLVTMKHVGLNVAADPLFTLAYTGVNAGLVVVTADDPGMHSSQNEQDSRYYAKAAKVPIIEPADSAEARDFLTEAFRVSEEYDCPVLFRTTTRVAHSKSIVDAERVGSARSRASKYQKDAEKYVMIPANARRRRLSLEERLGRLAGYADKSPLNQVEMNDTEIGVVGSGVAYQYAREAFPGASFLKLGMTNPLPAKLISEFASRVKRIFVVEELSPYLEEEIRLLGLAVRGKGKGASIGELNVERVRRAFDVAVTESAPDPEGLPLRPPMLCPGCPHRGVFHALNNAKATVMGDIGCYTLGVLPPLDAMDTCVCMGAGVGAALGFEKATGDKGVVAVIGDSTFVHSGITSLIDMVYNGGSGTVIILDNRTTAMTGRQNHPGTGRTLKGAEAPELDYSALARALGVEFVREIDPYDLPLVERTIKEAREHEGPAVIISRRPCVLLEKKGTVAYRVDESCTDCRCCVRLGCPALSKIDGGVEIDPSVCGGCGICVGLCKCDSIKRVGDD